MDGVVSATGYGGFDLAIILGAERRARSETRLSALELMDELGIVVATAIGVELLAKGPSTWWADRAALHLGGRPLLVGECGDQYPIAPAVVAAVRGLPRPPSPRHPLLTVAPLVVQPPALELGLVGPVGKLVQRVGHGIVLADRRLERVRPFGFV